MLLHEYRRTGRVAAGIVGLSASSMEMVLPGLLYDRAESGAASGHYHNYPTGLGLDLSDHFWVQMALSLEFVF